MCGILGWTEGRTIEERAFLLTNGNERGRDGYGFWVDGQIIRGIGQISDEQKNTIIKGNRVVGNFRATPTTEAESAVDLLQPYDGIVHNGVIANDKEYGDYPIDSMVLPKILDGNRAFDKAGNMLTKIKGSYALAYHNDNDLIMACNYKPIYYNNHRGLLFGSTPDMILSETNKMPPYTIMSYNGKLRSKEIPRYQSNRVLVSASSGLDSTTVAYMLKKSGYDITLAHLTYDCLAEEREIDRINKIAEHGGFDLCFIPLPKGIMRGTITSGNYHKNQIAGTKYAMDWISARNLLMLSVLTAYAESYGYGYIAFGGNLEESGAYPDNEQEFGRLFNQILPYSTQNGIKIELLQPVATLMKHEIVKKGIESKVPYELTWSCYSDQDKHCDNCGPCYMRKVAFQRNGLVDPVFA